MKIFVAMKIIIQNCLTPLETANSRVARGESVTI